MSYISFYSPWVTTGQPETNFLTYINSELGFTMEYPASWKVSEDVSSGTVFITPTENNGNPSSGVMAAYTPADTNASLHELGNKIIETNRNSEYATGFRLIESNTNSYFLGGYPAVRVVFVSSVERNEIRSVALGSIVNGKEYGLISFSDSESYSGYSDIFQHMTESFQIVPIQGR